MSNPASTVAGLRIDIDRLMTRLLELGEVGALEGGGVCRLALTDADRQGRDLVVHWMHELGLSPRTDRIGNVTAVRPGKVDGPPVMIGSHIDTVATGGLYDGNLGVLAGLEVIARLNDEDVTTSQPLAVAFFTNEEGVRFAPDMMGSAVHQGHYDLEDMLAVCSSDGRSLAAELERIGYAGSDLVAALTPRCYLELHVEQGPVLEQEGVTIGAVTGVQGISWTEYRLRGVSNHAGTTPMQMRHDAGYVAARIAVEARRLATEMGGSQVATVGVSELKPNLINVIANESRVTVDLRNTDGDALVKAERHMHAFVEEASRQEGLQLDSRSLVKLPPVEFDSSMVDLVARTAEALDCSVRRMPSGAGHDAQMFAPNCPTAMIFVPSRGGISHNTREHTERTHIEAGANVLLQTALSLAL